MKTLTVSREPRGVARVTMARPEVFNAFDEAMVAELDTTFAELGADDSVRVIVLTGEGKAFSAGADLEWMQRASGASIDLSRKDVRRLAEMLWRVNTCPKPTIARVNGIAFGSGVGLACACDIAVASKSASFAVTEAKFGMLPATIGPYVINAVGKRQARRLALTAQPITGEVRELTVKTIGRVRGTDEAREGMAAFHEKRPAHWTKAVRA
jgi:methylglutaconyl-CoA hydratase